MPKYRYEAQVVDVIDGAVDAHNKAQAIKKIKEHLSGIGEICDIELTKIPKDEEDNYYYD